MFRAGGATAELRHAFLDALADTAIAAQTAGSSVLSTSKNGAAVQFQFFDGWAPSDALELIDEARDWADAATATVALALIREDADCYRFDNSSAEGFR